MTDGAHDHKDYATKADLDALSARMVEAEKNLAADAQAIHENDERIHALEVAAAATQPPADEKPADPVPEDPPKADPPVDPPETPQKPDNAAFDTDLLVEPIGNPKDMVIPTNWQAGGSYFRGNRRTELSGLATLAYRHNAKLPITGEHKLVITPIVGDGRLTVAATDDPGGTNSGVFEFDTTSLQDGIYWSRIVRPDGRSSFRYPLYIRNGAHAQTVTVLSTGTYENFFGGNPNHVSARAPMGFKPRIVPARPRPEAKINGVPGDKLYSDMLVPLRSGNIYRPEISANGWVGTDNRQSYFQAQITHQYPYLALLDGPRGRGSFQPATRMRFHKRGGGIWFLDGWRLGQVKPDGVVVTIAGFRHDDLPPYHEDTDKVLPTLVGDWSRVEPKGMREAWDFLVDPRTTGVSDDLLVNGIPAHPQDVVFIVSDTQHNRLLKISCQGDKPIGEGYVIVEVLVDELDDPWGLAYGPAGSNQFAVSQRWSNRLSIFDFDGNFIRHLFDNSADADMVRQFRGATSNRFADSALKHSGLTINDTRQHSLIWPEGLDSWAHGDEHWIVVGSAAMGQILRFNWSTGERQMVVPEFRDNRSATVNITVCPDDSVFPAGTILATRWGSENHGAPNAYAQDGTRLDFPVHRRYFVGRGGSFPSLAYGSSCCVGSEALGHWGLAFCGSWEGLIRVSLAQDDDPPAIDSARFESGRKKYHARGYEFLHGQWGMGFHGLPLPVGEDPDIDYFLDRCAVLR
jgi:hypothetical protein